MLLSLNRIKKNATFTLDVKPMTALATLTVPSFNLPSTRTFRVTATLSATPSGQMPKPVSSKINGTSYPGVTLTRRLHKPLDSTGTVKALVLIEEKVSGTWRLYDSTDASPHAITIPKAPNVPTVKPKFGINVHIMIPKLRTPGSLNPMLQKLVGSQSTLVRASAPWSYMEPTANTFDSFAQSQCDAFADFLRANGMKWVVALAPVPAVWETGDANLLIAQNWSHYDSFLDRFLTRYGDVIAVVENVNEPNTETNPLIGRNGWTWATALTGQQHLYNRVQAHNTANGRSILTTAMAVAFGDAPFVESLYANGLGPYFDMVDIHPYNVRFDLGGNVASQSGNGVTGDPIIGWGDEFGAGEDLLNGIQVVAEVMAAHGDSAKKIIVTEWGSSTSFTGVNKTKSTLDVTEAQQAAQCATAIRQAARDPRVYGFLWYCLYDNAYNAAGPVPYDITQWSQCFGLTSPYGAKDKPALATFISKTANPA